MSGSIYPQLLLVFLQLVGCRSGQSAPPVTAEETDARLNAEMRRGQAAEVEKGMPEGPDATRRADRPTGKEELSAAAKTPDEEEAGAVAEPRVTSEPVSKAEDARAGTSTADLGPAGTGAMRGTDADGESVEFPARHTKVEIEVTGMTAGVLVTQEFSNPFVHPIEAVYVLPLPRAMTALDSMEINIGNRTIKGVIQDIEMVKLDRKTVSALGKMADLLEQERPHFFAQQVGRIFPGDDIRVSIRYLEDLDCEAGGCKIAFPLVVDRSGGSRTPSGTTEAGGAGDMGGVLPSSRPPSSELKPAERSGRDIDLSLVFAAGIPVDKVSSPSHDIVTTQLPGGGMLVTLSPLDAIPNEDFVLQFSSVGKELQVAPYFHASGADQYFMLVIQPEAVPRPKDIVPREVLYVVDGTSPSPNYLTECALECLRSMRPTDSFQLLMFSDAVSANGPAPQPATRENLVRAEAFFSGAKWAGVPASTDIQTALDRPPDPEKIRILALFVEGPVSPKFGGIGAAVEERLQGARLFTFETGAYYGTCLAPLSAAGRGYSVNQMFDGTPDVANRFCRRFETPLLVDIQVRATGPVRVFQLYPSPLPDLFHGQPLVVYGRFKGSGSGSIIVTGRRGTGARFRRELAVQWPETEPANALVAKLWAKSRTTHLADRLEGWEAADKIAKEGLRYQVTSQRTALLAVELGGSANGADGLRVLPITIVVPDPLPPEELEGLEDTILDGKLSGMLEERRSVPELDEVLLTPSSDWKLTKSKAEEKKKAEATLMDTKLVVEVGHLTGFGGGRVDEKEVGKYLRFRSSSFQKCFSMVLRKAPRTGGKLRLKVTIDMAGRATAMAILDGTGDPELAKCVIGKISEWSFPKPEGKPAQFTLPMEFRIVGGALQQPARNRPEEPVSKEPDYPSYRVARRQLVVLDGPLAEESVQDVMEKAQARIPQRIAKMHVCREPTSVVVPGLLTIGPEGKAHFESQEARLLAGRYIDGKALAEFYVVVFGETIADAVFPRWSDPTVVKLETLVECR